jgi:uncharacterized protein YcbX
MEPTLRDGAIATGRYDGPVDAPNGTARISRIAIAPVKGLALQHPDEVELASYGVAENRRVHLIDEAGRLINDKQAMRLMLVSCRLDLAAGTLALCFPEGVEVEAELALGEPNTTIFFGRPVDGHLLAGPWSRALSQWMGRDLRLVMSEELGAGSDRGVEAAVSIISQASVSEIARAGGAERLDARRFRMLFDIECVEAFAEESWIGRDVQIGDAVVRPNGNVGRCAVTSCDPETALRDFDTLRVLATQRKDVQTTEPLPLGVFGQVVTPGRVRVGDPVLPV